MDVLKISDTKVKIMLDARDVEKFGLNIDNVDYNDQKTRSRVWDILDYVKKKHGFDHGKDKLLIQFYPSKDGGAELFVTRLTGLSRGNERAISKVGNVTMLDSRRMIYNFKNFGDLLRGAKIIEESKNIKDSELFYDTAEGYYLEITERGTSRLDTISEFVILLEFATAITKEKFPYITEHCEKLTSGNAVKLLAKIC